MDFTKVIRTIPDFPRKGVIFRDVTPVLQYPESLREVISALLELTRGLDFDLIAGPESKGFIFGMPLAYELNKGFIPIRKEGKLPRETYRKTYALEYGSAVIEMHRDSIVPGQKVIIIDDVLATGGTCKAITELIEGAGGIVTADLFFVELTDLGGKDLLRGYDVRSIVKY